MKEIILILILFISIQYIAFGENIRPSNIPKEAKKYYNTNKWSYEDKKGNSYIWYSNGVLSYKNILIASGKYFKLEQFHENGKLFRIGYSLVNSSLFDPQGGYPLAPVAFGKRKEYDIKGNIENEWCYTVVEKDEVLDYQKCSVEKIYKNGKLVKTIHHKYNCIFGCSTPEEDGNPYNQKDYFVFYQPTIGALRLRTGPTLKSKFIRYLNKQDMMVIRGRGKKEVINGKKGQWVKVITLGDEVGWCFDAYLKKMKNL